MATEAVSKQQSEPRFSITSVKPVRADLGPAGASQLINISATGIRVKSLAPLRRDAEVPVRIDIPDRLESLRCSATVVWSKPNGAAGLKLKNLDENQKQLLKSWLADFEKGELAAPPVDSRDEFAAIVAQIKDTKLNNVDSLNLIVRRITEFTSASGVVIALGKPEHMVCVASEGEAPEVGTPVPNGAGLTGECIRGRRMVLCQNAATDPRVKKDPHFASAVVLPLLVNGELRGMLQVFSKTPCAFDPKSLEALEQLSDVIVVVMHGVTPQRRVDGPESPTQPVTPKSKIVTRNGTLSPTESGNWVFTVPPRSEQNSLPAPTVPVAAPAATVQTATAASSTPVVVPIAEPVKPALQSPSAGSPIVEMPRPEVRQASILEMPKPATVPLSTNIEPPAFAETPSSSNAKWIFGAVAALVLIAAPVGYAVWHHLQTDAVVQAAAENSPAVPNVPQPNLSAPSSLAVPTAIASVKEKTPAPTPIQAAPENKHKVEPQPTKLEIKDSSTASTATKPEPMLLPAGHSLKPAGRTDEVDVAAPTFSQAASFGSSMSPAVALPATASVPKLTAQVATSWTGGTLLRRVAPVYPAAARAEGLGGAVDLKVVIKKDGTIGNIKVISGNPLLARAAVDAVRLWRYDPFKADGVPTDKEASITLNFTIPR